MLHDDFIGDLKCPACAKRGKGSLKAVKDGAWLRCGDCERNYPVTDGIPVLLITEGDTHKGRPVDSLPGGLATS